MLVNDKVYKQQEKYNNITKQQREQVNLDIIIGMVQR